MDLVGQLVSDLSLRPDQVRNALELFEEGATVPFVARYRKERTGEMDEVQLRVLRDRHAYLVELEARKATVLEAIAAAGKLTDKLRHQIETCTQKTVLEDLYLPYRPKRRTRATIAKDRGLEPLADRLETHNKENAPAIAIEKEAAKYVNAEAGVADVAAALQGASDILAERVAERATLRATVRAAVLKTGVFVSKIGKDYPEASTKFEMYRNYTGTFGKIAPHNVLALLRGQKEGILSLSLDFDEAAIIDRLSRQVIHARASNLRQFYGDMLADAFSRLMKPSAVNAAIADRKAWADAASIQTFAANLKELLLAAPAGMKPTLGMDPGFRTGCKVAAIDRTGKLLDYRTIFPHQSAGRREDAAATVRELIAKHQIETIAIGNGTASRETDTFVREAIASTATPPIVVTVSEAGASVYSASEVAIAEFPDLDVTVRGAISIGRRLQDPLAELVKVEPQAIGVGQYQHDVDRKLLKKQLDETVESCVNYVGVDLNTASKELLGYVAGLTPKVADNIVVHRNENGVFKNRGQLLKVAKLGPKAFEQAAGFLRIRDGDNPLDNTAVHPESYGIIETIAKDLDVPLDRVGTLGERLQTLDLKRFVTDRVGEPTLRDIASELEKPGRDPRAEFTYATFKEGVESIADLKEGMELEGVVTNVANFGAFVDVGVHQDGLVHISQLADRFVKDPKDIVKVGQVVAVRVMEVDEKRKRIGLSMKAVGGDRSGNERKPRGKHPRQPEQPASASLDDLRAKFNRPRSKRDR
ncbi:MAG: Tex family protein [Cyanobacteria bacterium P01_H01_bin.15]